MRKKRKLYRFILVLLTVFAAFAMYVVWANRDSKNMNTRQKILKAVYPALMWIRNLGGSNTVQPDETKKVVEPPVSFYSLQITLNNGSSFSFDSLRGRKCLLVNTASECGYTRQYEDLQKLSEQYADRLTVIGFPANDFKQQEKGSDEEIAEFCRLNFGVSFPLSKKTTVVPGPDQHPVYRWLTDKKQNGWNEQTPAWNFSKYLIDENGRLLGYFDSGVSPLSETITSKL